MAEKMLLETHGKGSEVAIGIQLANGTALYGREVISSAGANRTPQLLKVSVSGNRASSELRAHGIPVVLGAPDVGQHAMDHPAPYYYHKFRNASAGWAFGSGNSPPGRATWYGLRLVVDFNVQTDVAKEGLAHAIALDEGGVTAAQVSTHPLLARNRTFTKDLLPTDVVVGDSHVLLGGSGTGLLPMSCETGKLASRKMGDAPLVDPAALGPHVDRCVMRHMLQTQAVCAGSDATLVGREVLDGEDPGCSRAR